MQGDTERGDPQPGAGAGGAEVLVDVASRPAGTLALSDWADLVVASGGPDRSDSSAGMRRSLGSRRSTWSQLTARNRGAGEPVGLVLARCGPILGMRLVIGSTHAANQVEALSRCGDELVDPASGGSGRAGRPRGLHAAMVSGSPGSLARQIAPRAGGDVPAEVVETLSGHWTPGSTERPGHNCAGGRADWWSSCARRLPANRRWRIESGWGCDGGPRPRRSR